MTRRDFPTIGQIAAKAGVSRATVSRAFTRPDLLSEATVHRVRTIAGKLGYIPNHAARALSTGRHANIAVIVPDIANPFFPPLIGAVQREADRFDFCVFLGNSGENPAQEDKLVDRFSGQVAGLILVSSRLTEERIRRHAERLPVVLINRDVSGISRALIDSGKGVREAVAHLAECGHKRIAYVAGPGASWSNRQRQAAVRSATKRRAMTLSIVPAEVPTYEAGRAAAGPVLAAKATAVIAFDDLIAQGILAGLAERGASVPADVSVVGCDDVLGAATYPPLTTVSNQCDEAGQAALSLLMKMLERREPTDVRHVLETHLVIRQTTGRHSS